MRQRLAEYDRDKQELARLLEESQKNHPGRMKNKKSSRKTQTTVTETATVQTEGQARTGPVTRQAARVVGEMKT